MPQRARRPRYEPNQDSTQIRHFVESASKVNSADRGSEYFQEGELDA